MQTNIVTPIGMFSVEDDLSDYEIQTIVEEIKAAIDNNRPIAFKSKSIKFIPRPYKEVCQECESKK